MTLDEFKKDLDKPKSWIVETYYWFYRLWFNGIVTIPSRIKCFYQRGRYGFSYQDVWSIDWYLLHILPPMIRQLQRDKQGYPAMLVKEGEDDPNGDKGMAIWMEILDKMASGFELKNAWEDDYPKVVGVLKLGKNLKEDAYYYDFKDPAWYAKYEIKQKEVDHAFEDSKQLLIEFWEALWD